MMNICSFKLFGVALLYIGSVSSTPTGFCEYKCRQYTQGETWDDGCQYKCTCVDASTGNYMCRERCPNFAHAPDTYCLLVQDPDDHCCLKPLCIFNGPHIFNITGDVSGCVFNGHVYGQGESWPEGCTKYCTCNDATSGRYSCREMCLNFSELPCTCQMKPAPAGLCCEQPWCPSGVDINIPQSYKDQYPGYTYT